MNRPEAAPQHRPEAHARLRCWVDGLAFWSPALPGWPEARAAFLDGAAMPDAPSARPGATLLGSNERRRAPDAVLLALEVAQAAALDAQQPLDSITSVFTSAHGDLPVVDALCRTLAADPLLLSPTRFHHSVHNAASGYWALASGSHAPSTALAGYDSSFATGLLEAFSQCHADQQPVLLVGCDTGACGALASTNASRGLLGVALVLAPAPSARSRWHLQLRLHAGPAPRADALRSAAAQALSDNAQADALPLYEALARTDTAGADAAGDRLRVIATQTLTLRLGAAAHLQLVLTPVNVPGPVG
jgi:hypothetical protein